MDHPLLTPEQALQAAPDASAASNAQKLAKPAGWQSLHYQDHVLWGSIQGSALYHACVHLDGLAFKCSCPSRKQPCKHGLALLLCYARDFGKFSSTEPPEWVSNWLAKRDESAARKLEKAQAPREVDSEAQARRQASRDKKVAAGIAELRLWLDDLLRQGLAQARSLGSEHFSRMTGRLVDAQATGLAAQIGQLQDALRRPDWQQAVPLLLGQLHLLLQAYERLTDLPENLQADVRSLIGWSVAQEEVLATPVQADDWLVLAHRDQELDNNGRVRRQWLWGLRSRQAALLVGFSFGQQALPPALPHGAVLSAELHWYPAAVPQRALLREGSRTFSRQPLPVQAGHARLQSALQEHAEQLARNPLLTVSPWLLHDMLPLWQDQQWLLVDSEGLALPARVQDGWALLALSGGLPLSVFGEWDGSSLLLLNAWQGEEIVSP